MIVKGDLRRVFILQVETKEMSFCARAVCVFCFIDPDSQSCDDFVSSLPFEPSWGSVSDDKGEGSGVIVEWCRYKNCSVSNSHVSLSSPPSPPTDVSFGGRPVALIRDLFPVDCNAARDEQCPSRALSEEDSADDFRAHVGGETKGINSNVNSGMTVVVVPYRNRTKALVSLVRVAESC
jgi:hypothetical protein